MVFAELANQPFKVRLHRKKSQLFGISELSMDDREGMKILSMSKSDDASRKQVEVALRLMHLGHLDCP